MDESTIKERILKTLLESPKTTGEIAKLLGYVDVNGNGKYNNIKTDLNTLQVCKIISCNKIKKPGVSGPAPTIYQLIWKIDVLKQTLNKYPNLGLDMRKNKKIGILLSDAYWNNIFFDDSKWILRETETIFKHNFTLMINHSNTFFKTILMNSPEDALDHFVQIYENSMIGIGNHRKKYRLERLEKTEIDKEMNKIILKEELYRTAFEACVKADILNNQAEPTAIEMIKRANTIYFEYFMSEDVAFTLKTAFLEP